MMKLHRWHFLVFGPLILVLQTEHPRLTDPPADYFLKRGAMLQSAPVIRVESLVSGEKKRIERADQLPTHEYRVPANVSGILTDDRAFGSFARSVQSDIEAD